MSLKMKEQKQFVKHSKQTKHFWNYLYGVCKSFTLVFIEKIMNKKTENKIGDGGAKAMAEMIKTNTTIQVIDLSGNHKT